MLLSSSVGVATGGDGDTETVQRTEYEIAPLMLDIEHAHVEKVFVQPARAMLHRLVPTPSTVT